MDHTFSLSLSSASEDMFVQLCAYYRSSNKDLSDDEICFFIFKAGLEREFKSFQAFSKDISSLLSR